MTSAGQATHPKTFSAQTPTRFVAIEVFTYDDPGGCPVGNTGFFVSVDYRVLDQNDDVITAAGMTSLEELIINGGKTFLRGTVS